MLADARDKAAPVLADARDKAAPVLADARDKAAPSSPTPATRPRPTSPTPATRRRPYVSDARDRFNADVAPGADRGAGRRRRGHRGRPRRDQEARQGRVAALKGEVEAPAKKKHRVPQAAGRARPRWSAAAVAKKLSDRRADHDLAVVLHPAAGPAPAPARGRRPPWHRRRPHGRRGRRRRRRSDPDEAAADAADEPHDATTPDNPVETIDVKHD